VHFSQESALFFVFFGGKVSTSVPDIANICSGKLCKVTDIYIFPAKYLVMSGKSSIFAPAICLAYPQSGLVVMPK
jgi:hypothetical protein